MNECCKKTNNMAGQEKLRKSRVEKVESEEKWDLFTAKGSNNVVVHFTAGWCIPSLAMNNFFEELAFNSHQGIQFLSVDVDDVKAIAAKMEIKAMPTFIMIKNGVQVDKVVGANLNELRKRVHRFEKTISAIPS